MKKVLINSVRVKAINIASPPIRGIGLVCTFRDEGRSTAPSRVPSFPIKGLRIRDRINEMVNITRRVVILSYNKLKAEGSKLKAGGWMNDGHFIVEETLTLVGLEKSALGSDLLTGVFQRIVLLQEL